MKSRSKLLEVMARIAANVEGAILGEWSVQDGPKQAELAILVNEPIPGRTFFRSAFTAPVMISVASV